MAGPDKPDMTFAPEEVKQLTPAEKLKLSRERARKAHEHLQQAAPEFDFQRFKREFVPKLITAYNQQARIANLPLFNPAWLDLLQQAKGGAAAPKDFYVKYRSGLQPKMFPGDPAKARKAYDTFLKELEKAPLVRSGPSSGMLSHESGHLRGYYEDPEAAIRSRRPRTPSGSGFMSTPGAKPVMETAINEAVASYNGMKVAWKAWGKYGIPRKAWAAWSGFPTYTSRMTDRQVKTLMIRLKKMDDKYPGIYNQAYKAMYDFGRYVEPVLYNAPGIDWSPKEKAALKRFLKARGAPYREDLFHDVTDEERLRHMKRQPYVMREEEAPSRVASAFPLSTREAGEVVPFPYEKVSPPEEKEKPADILSPQLASGSFLVFVKAFPVGWYEREPRAVEAAKGMADAFIAGRPSLLGEAVRMDAPSDDLVDWMMETHREITEPVEMFLTDPRYREARERASKMMVSVLSIPGEPPAPDQRSEGIPSGDLYELEDKFRAAARDYEESLDWDRIAWATDMVNADIRTLIAESVPAE